MNKQKEGDLLVNDEGLVQDPIDIGCTTVPLLDEEVSF